MWEYILLILIIIYCFKKYSIETIKYYALGPMYFSFATTFAVLLIPFFLLRPRDPRNIIYFKWPIKLYSWMFGIKWEIKNPEIIAEDKGAILVLNHQHFLDGMLTMVIAQRANKQASIVKKEMFYLFPFGQALYLCGTIFVDRNRNGLKNMKKVADALIQDKTKLLVFPEGTRNDKFPKLLEFKKGAFNMAVDAQVPIIPVITLPYYFINKTKKTLNDGTITLECLEPIPTKGLTREDVPELTSRVHDLMQDAFIKLSKELLAKLPADYPHDYHL